MIALLTLRLECDFEAFWKKKKKKEQRVQNA